MNPQALKQQAQQLLQKSQPRPALELLDTLSHTTPNDPEVWFLLGLAMIQLANPVDAEQSFRRCVKLRPDAFAAWDNLGLSLIQQGKLNEAKQPLLKSVKLNRVNPIPHNGLGQLYRLQGNLKQSLHELRESLRINPNFADAHQQLALSLLASNQLPEAIQHARRATELNPSSVSFWQTLGESLHKQQDFQGALNAYQRALQLQPQALTWFSLGALMEELNHRDDARNSYSKAIELQPQLLIAHIRLAAILKIDGEINAARNHLEHALEVHPNHPLASAELSRLLAAQGHYDKAYRQIKPLLKGIETPIEIALAFAEISRPIKQNDQALKLLEQIAAQDTVPAEQRESFLFALASLHEQARHYEQAFQHYLQAHSLSRLPNDIERHLAEMEEIRSVFSREHLAKLPHSTQESQRPIFIVGMPRSGTSLVEQILAAHPDVHGGGELPLIWQFVRRLPEISDSNTNYPSCIDGLSTHHLNALANEYLGRLASLSPHKQRVTDKLPHNFVHLGLIEMLFPRARIIHCMRDPLDTCLSIWFHKFNTSHLYARDLRSLGRYYRGYKDHMQHWEKTLSLPILNLQYEDLVADLAGQSRRLVEFCELEWNNKCLRFHAQERTVNTPSHAQVRQPIYRTSMQRWRNFEPWINPLRDGLELNT